MPDVIDVEGACTSEETIPPAPRQRSIDVSPVDAARMQYRENYDRVFVRSPAPRQLPGADPGSSREP